MKALTAFWGSICFWYATIFNWFKKFIAMPLSPVVSFFFGSGCEVCTSVRMTIFAVAALHAWWWLCILVLLLRVLDKLCLAEDKPEPTKET